MIRLNSALTFRAFVFSTAFVSVIALASCDAVKNQLDTDRPAEASAQDYIDVLAPRPLPVQAQADIPDFQSILSTPEDLRLPTPLVTVSVNQRVGLRDLIFELADQAGVDVEIDPQIRGSIIFTAKDRPFDQVVQRICEMAGLRYKFKENVLRVELDRPYAKNYSVDFLTGARKGSTSINTALSLGGGGGTDGGSTSGGSSSSIETSVDGDLWDELDKNLEQILSSSDTYISLASLSDPAPTPVNPAPPATPVAEGEQAPPPPLPGDPRVAPMPASAAPVINVASVAQDPVAPSAPATFSISKQTGVVSVFASERQQRTVAKYLDDFRKRASTQVLIEARVLQVDLKDEFSSGVDWSAFDLTGLARVGSLSFPNPSLKPALTGGAGQNLFQLAINPGNDVNATIRAISRFGTVRTLSSPRITVLNNQPAVVNVAENTVYFDFNVDTETDDDTGKVTVTVDSEQKSAPEGVILNVVPVANASTGEITLSVRPSITKIRGTVEDPTLAVSLAAAGVKGTDLADALDKAVNNIPEITVQEMDSVLRMQSGQTMILGGLMRDSNNTTEVKVPIAGDIPLIGNLFKNHVDGVIKSEIIIFITATIVPGSNVHDTDREIYQGFALDRRPVKM
jgi:general secretion pathway protein D